MVSNWISFPDHLAGKMHERLAALRDEIAQCRICLDNPVGAPLPHRPRPVLHVSSTARLLICGQAPGVRVHNSGIPFNDPSGDRLRDWLGIGRDVFYDQSRIAIVPMGFCFPGLDARKADLPPRRECRSAWHGRLFELMPQVELILLVGAYARDYHFDRFKIAPRPKSMTETVKSWRCFEGRSPRLFPLPHPSWRNSGWLKRNPWFEDEVLPGLRQDVAGLLDVSASAAAMARITNFLQVPEKS